MQHSGIILASFDYAPGIYIIAANDVDLGWFNLVDELYDGVHSDANLQHMADMYGVNSLLIRDFDLCPPDYLLGLEQAYLNVYRAELINANRAALGPRV